MAGADFCFSSATDLERQPGRATRFGDEGEARTAADFCLPYRKPPGGAGAQTGLALGFRATPVSCLLSWGALPEGESST